MNKSIKFFLLIVILFAPVNYLYPQNTIDKAKKGKIVKWESLSGKDNEFIFYLPQGFETVVDGDFYLGKNATKRVDKKLVVARYINGVVLMTEYYEGDAKDLKDTLQEREKFTAGKSAQVNGFEFSEFSGRDEKYYYKTQYFRIKNRLYVIKTISKSEDDKIVKEFFSAVKLVGEGKAISPNVPKEITEIALSNIVESENVAADGEPAIDSKDADRKVLLLVLPRPKFPRNGAGARTGGQVKLKVLFSASGKITNVEVLESPSRETAAAAVEAMNKVKFIPAEKNGRLVSVYQTQGYNFSL